MQILYTELTPDNLKDPTLLNAILKSFAEELNRLGGTYGTIVLSGDVDLQGKRILNVGVAQSSTDALTQNSANPLYGPAQIQKTMEATGNKMLQTTRRLGDTFQRETTSTYMNQIGSTPPNSNTSNVTVVAAGANSNITVTAGVADLADGSEIPYASRMDTFVNPGVGSNYYHYYFRVSDATLQFSGPYTSNTSQNRMTANIDGRQYVGTAQVNVGGGGTGGGGGDPGTDGCTEIGTPLEFYPGSRPRVQILPCKKWIHFTLEDGTQAPPIDPNTLVSVFMRGYDLRPGMLVERGHGKFSKVDKVWPEERESFKQKVTEPVNGVYLGLDIRFHNTKA